jgi:hypothetical protein
MCKDGPTISNHRKVGSATNTCPLQVCKIVVKVERKDHKKLSQRVDIDVQGPTPKSAKTAPVVGQQVFDQLTPCKAPSEFYTVSITPSGDEAGFHITATPPDAKLHIPGGQTGTFIFELSPAPVPAWIKFKVVDEAPPTGGKAEIPDVRLSVKHAGQDQPAFSPKTTATGVAEIRDVEPGTCDIEGMSYDACVLEVVGDVQSA